MFWCLSQSYRAVWADRMNDEAFLEVWWGEKSNDGGRWKIAGQGGRLSDNGPASIRHPLPRPPSGRGVPY